jgi:hypothetical protein
VASCSRWRRSVATRAIISVLSLVMPYGCTKFAFAPA